MECPLCGHLKVHKHSKTSNGFQRYCCPSCQQPFNERFDTLYYYRYVSPEQIDQVLQAPSEGTSLRGISRISGLAHNTVVSLIRSSSSKAQLVHNDPVEAVETEEVSGDELWSFGQKNKSNVCQRNSQ